MSAFLAVSGESTLRQSGQDSRPSRKSSKTPTASESSSVIGRMSTDASTSTISPTATMAQLTLFPEGHHANPRVLPGSEEAKKMTAGSGRRCFESCERFFPDGSWQKTLLESFLLKTGWQSKKCLLGWNLRGMKSSRRLSIRLQVWTRGTKGKEFLLLPTPVATDGGGNRSDSPNAAFRPSLRALAMKGMIPTPTARDWKNSIGSDVGRHTETLAHWAYKLSGIRGPLNPAFVEEIMGFPIGWTDCEPSETQ
jgi:hypothetical protein